MNSYTIVTNGLAPLHATLCASSLAVTYLFAFGGNKKIKKYDYTHI